ncbi:MAG: DUF2007 domain-containing protein [Flavobacteriales bacterium]|nr:DUF2007 domain-containing protein [Flavobacteriales bacterium]
MDAPSDWTLVYSAGSLPEAELVRGRLQEHGIEALIMDQSARVYPQIGEVGIYVPRAQVLQALHLVRNPEKP